MSRYNLLFILILIVSLFLSSVQSIENRIVYKVNNEIITSIDITDEFKYLQIINPKIINLDKDKIYEISKNSIIREKIKKIEILKIFKDLSISKEYIDKVLRNTYLKIGINSQEDFTEYLNIKGLNFDQFKQKLVIEAKWNEIIFNKFRSKVKIDKDTIEKNFLLSAKREIKSFNLSEIIFEVNKNENLDKKYKLIKKEIANNGYENAALIYSVSDTSNMGGMIGWIDENSLNKKIKKNLDKLKIGDITEPITIPGGFLILKINDEKKIKKELNVQKEVQKIMNTKLNQQLNQYSNIYFNKIKKDIKIEKI